MIYFLLLVVLPLFFVWHMWFVPKVGASIAADHGDDYKKWHINIILFGIFAVIYIVLGIDRLTDEEKRAFKIILFGSLFSYVCFFGTCFMLDR